MQLGSCSDDFYVNLNVNTEMELSRGRESVLHFFEQLKKRYPQLRNFYSRDTNDYVLEEEKDSGAYRWASVEPKRFCSGYVNPTRPEDAIEQHEAVLELAPYALSASPMDIESINIMYGFDFSYCGNHNELIAEALGLPPAFDSLADEIQGRPVAYEPSFQIALDEDCRLQCRVSVEPRTSAYHVRSGNYPDEQISVYITTRRYGSLEFGESFLDAMHKLHNTCQEVVENYAMERILLPLQQIISIK